MHFFHACLIGVLSADELEALLRARLAWIIGHVRARHNHERSANSSESPPHHDQSTDRK